MSITLGSSAGVAEFKAAAAQELNQRTVADPLPENPSHALVIGNKSQSVKRALRDAATFTPLHRETKFPESLGRVKGRASRRRRRVTGRGPGAEAA